MHKTTMEEYEELAEELQLIRSLVMKFDIKICKQCGKKYNLDNSRKNIDNIKHILEIRMCKEHPIDWCRDEYIFYNNYKISDQINKIGITEFVKQLKR